MAYTKTTWQDKAVQFAKRYFMNWDGGNDKNLLPPLSDWVKHANAVVTSPYTLTLTATASYQTTSFTMYCVPSQAYTFSSTIGGYISPSFTPYISIQFLDINGASLGFNDGAGIVSATAPTNAVKLVAHLLNEGSGTFTFTNPQLELGSSATAFAPKKMYTITQSGGTVTQAGTPVNAANLNKIEQGVSDAHAGVQDTQILMLMGAL